MTGPNLKFTRQEFADRLKKTRAAMPAREIDSFDLQRSIQYGVAHRI